MKVRIAWLLVVISLTNAAAVMVAEEPKPADQPITPAVGDLLPAFENSDDQGAPWKSADHVGKKVLVLYFYPGDFTSGCIKQAEAYREGLAKIESLGVELVGVSAGNPIILDRPATIARWTLVVGRDGKIESVRNILNPATDTEEVFKIVAALPR